MQKLKKNNQNRKIPLTRRVVHCASLNHNQVKFITITNVFDMS